MIPLYYTYVIELDIAGIVMFLTRVSRSHQGWTDNVTHALPWSSEEEVEDVIQLFDLGVARVGKVPHYE